MAAHLDDARPTGRDARAAVIVALVVLVVSALAGAVWGWVIPGEQLLVVEPGRGSLLTGQSAHEFDAVAVFVCFGGVLGLLSAFAVWRWRSARGPLLQLGLLVGSLLGAYVMARLGEHVAAWHHPRPHNPAIGSVVTLPVDSIGWAALLVQPLFASLVVMFAAALSSSDDLRTPRGQRLGDGAAAGFSGAPTHAGAHTAEPGSVAYGGGATTGDPAGRSEFRPGG